MNLPSSKCIRESMMKKRSALTPDAILERSKKICEQIKSTPQYQESNTLAFYYPFRGEVSLKSLWYEATLSGKQCFFPKCDGTEMYFLPADPKTQFLPSQLGMLEPCVDKSNAIAKEALELVLMPLVSFDLFGVRLGGGKGFYDRAFDFVIREKSPFLLGVAYQFQASPQLEKKAWDIPLNAIATEDNVEYFLVR